MRLIAVITLLMLLTIEIRAASPQQIPQLNFEEFEPLLHKENDSIYIINFWATWCAPCVREIPAFEKLGEKFNNHKVKVLLVSLDFPNQLNTRLIPFIKKHEIKNTVILLDDPNANEWIDKVSEKWTGAVPATLIYSEDYREFFEKEFHYNELEQIVESLLKANEN